MSKERITLPEAIDIYIKLLPKYDGINSLPNHTYHNFILNSILHTQNDSDAETVASALISSIMSSNSCENFQDILFSIHKISLLENDPHKKEVLEILKISILLQIIYETLSKEASTATIAKTFILSLMSSEPFKNNQNIQNLQSSLDNMITSNQDLSLIEPLSVLGVNFKQICSNLEQIPVGIPPSLTSTDNER